jgi:hypothetical protein
VPPLSILASDMDPIFETDGELPNFLDVLDPFFRAYFRNGIDAWTKLLEKIDE